MPNWCSTTYAFFGDPDAVRDFHKKIELYTSKLRWDDSPREPLTFRWNWLGNIVTGFGLDPDKVYCRGEISAVTPYDDHILVATETAWSPMNDVWDEIIAKHYKGNRLQYVYIAEEPGCDIFINTDDSGIFFSEKYLLDDGDGVYEYFSADEEEEMCDWLRTKFNCTGNTPAELVKSYNEIYEPQDKYMSLHIFQPE